MVMQTLTFLSRHDYSNSNSGIEVPIILSIGDHRRVRLAAKVDTGASFCIFQRDYGEQLGIDVETGLRQRVKTAAGSFDAFGHNLTLACLDWKHEAMVYFAQPSDFSRNVVGRSGWLQHFRVAIIDYDSILHISHYND
jgi:hypothetical protein